VNNMEGKNRFITARKSERGFTLIETLVAIALLLGVLIPAILFLGKATMSRSAGDLITAESLAVETMEKTTAFRLFRNSETLVETDRKKWRVVRVINKNDGLVEIRVRVYRLRARDPIVEFKTLRIEDD
jgi:prepilin-type N-terminal cleavage/methylation domain-containing protein